MDYREVGSFFYRRYPRRRQKDYKFPNLNLVRAPLIIMYACSAIHLGPIRPMLRPMPRFVFKFIRISVDGENIENDTKTIVRTENILSVFGAKTPGWFTHTTSTKA